MNNVLRKIEQVAELNAVIRPVALNELSIHQCELSRFPISYADIVCTLGFIVVIR
jgi:hypothetical protein